METDEGRQAVLRHVCGRLLGEVADVRAPARQLDPFLVLVFRPDGTAEGVCAIDAVGRGEPYPTDLCEQLRRDDHPRHATFCALFWGRNALGPARGRSCWGSG